MKNCNALADDHIQKIAELIELLQFDKIIHDGLLAKIEQSRPEITHTLSIILEKVCPCIEASPSYREINEIYFDVVGGERHDVVRRLLLKMLENAKLINDRRMMKKLEYAIQDIFAKYGYPR